MNRFFAHFKDRQCELGTTKNVFPAAVEGQKGEVIKMLSLSVPDTDAAPVLISLRTEYSVIDGIAGIGSPIVGLLQWGVGGGENQLDFDIPAPRLPALIVPATPPNQPTNNIGNGVQVFVSTSHISLYVRHDGNIGPLTNPTGDHVGSITPVKVICFVSPGEGSGRPALERTIMCAGGTAAGPPAATPLTPAAIVNVTVPPFAKTARFQRLPYGTPLRVTSVNNFGVTYREVNVPVNDEGPIPIDAWAQEIRVQNTGAVNIDFLQVVFDVTPS